MSRLLTLLILIGCAAMAANVRDLLAADQAPDAAIAPFLGDQTFAVAAIDLTAPGNRPPGAIHHRAGRRRRSKPTVKSVRRSARSCCGWRRPAREAEIRANLDCRRSISGRTAYLVATCSDVFGAFTNARPAQGSFGKSLFLVLPGLKPETIQKLGKDMAESPGNKQTWTCREIHACAVLAEPKLLERLAGLKPTTRPDLAAALAAAGERPLRIAVAPPALFAQAAGEILRSPAAGTAAPLGESLAGFRWAALGMDVEPGASRPASSWCRPAAPTMPGDWRS